MRELVGHVGVDAGLIMVGDPCYVLGDDASSRVTDWLDFCDKLWKSEDDQGGVYKPFDWEQTGICVSSGYGDGSYPVYVEREHGRIKSITVEFMEDDYGDDDY